MTKEALFFKLLSDDTRLRVLNVMLAADASLCVCEITDALQLPQYQISKHLFLLRSIGLVSADRKGTWVYYSLKEDRLQQQLFRFLRTYLKDGLFAADRGGLRKRLGKREGGKCVIGFAKPAMARA